MEPEPTTFPTLRRWQRMSESEQDALLDKIEARRRWGAVGMRVMIAIAGIACAGLVAALVLSN